MEATKGNKKCHSSIELKPYLKIDSINYKQKAEQNRFRIMQNFIKPNSPLVINKKAGFYNQKESCVCYKTLLIGGVCQRKRFSLELIGNRLKLVSSKGAVVQFFNFETEEVEVSSSGSYFVLSVKECPKKFYFEPAEEHSKTSIVQNWVICIQNVIDGTLGKQKHLTFHSREHISSQQFAKSCNSLDIMLFKVKTVAGRLIRFVTNSTYNHVGVILRSRKNEIFIYHSGYPQGVQLTAWKHILSDKWYHDFFDEIVWRRLQIQLKDQDIAQIDSFVAKTLGKRYEMNLSKLIRRSSALHRSVEEQNEKTYFCSQLVARLYKELGLLDAEKSSARYYPDDFTSTANLKLKREGVYLQAERTVVLNPIP